MPRKVTPAPAIYMFLASDPTPQNRTPESLALNRENQRRSRARQRELVEDLQRRVREYERRDGQATLDMQRVARAVAGENAALRGLLASKGVAADEIEAHLEAVRAEEKMVVEAGVSSALPIASTPVSTSSGTASPIPLMPRAVSYSQPKGCSPNTIPQDSANTPSVEEQPGTRSQEISAPARQCCKREPVAITPPMTNSAETGCCGQLQPQAEPLPKPLDKIHCMEAATILAQIRGHPDVSQARAALGCSMNDDCLVRNTDLLGMMDEMA
ncbi:hypothetical protein FALBO_900 [Fusarium albosuccineum]|uniref:BZIP domain-containing protein n=1 Tax=Fusarium albosuccineum TaxID=1237068 RepID=A0A8H4PIS8_9HYPO|nr:hypothetical protein FALBO_900 [Fusarium albosuccineum]